MKKIYPEVFITGAGPGDPSLLTLKAYTLLQKADVVLYDALVSKEILELIPLETKKIYVGKRKNKHAYTQQQINQLIVSLAFTYGKVVRLKGGDPFVFGRGFEEFQDVDSFNIPVEYVPGISSSVAVPGIAGIPVTHRGSSESFWVITATTRNGEISNDVYDAAKANATIVILMGLSKLKEITEIFIANHKSHLPVAIVSDGTLPTQKTIIGTIRNIEEAAFKNGVKAPAVIIIGEVVKQYKNYFRELSHQNVFTEFFKN